MDPFGKDILRRASEYSGLYGLCLEHRLGFGKDGTVWATDRATAVKVFAGTPAYEREVAAFRRLGDHGIDNVLGHRVPHLLRCNDLLRVIEMTIVHPPFLLDFASAWLDQEPDFGEEVLEKWHEEKQEQFGERWPDVLKVMAVLQRHGIHLMDVHPGNITFARPSP